MDAINAKGEELENALGVDVGFYCGPIHHAIVKEFRNFIERLADLPSRKPTLALLLTTGGGLVETVERMVTIMRQHYDSVHFVVPDFAMSAGTILCMSGDKIFMDYSSTLGPIDPQVLTKSGSGEDYVPALGYLEQVERLIEKSRNGSMTPAEYALLQNQDLALLRRYEQARDLSIELLKTWLVRYKFKNWDKHKTDLKKKGEPVTPEEKAQRAEEIARKLGDNKIWHSHGRMIGIKTLEAELRLEIDDYTDNKPLRQTVRVYNDLLIDYIGQMNRQFYMHNWRTAGEAQ